MRSLGRRAVSSRHPQKCPHNLAVPSNFVQCGMDSVSQIALGAAVSVAVMGRRAPVWQAAAWGAVAGTLPDLDVFIDQGNPIANMVLHRAESHALFWLTLLALPFSAVVAKINGQWGQWALWRRWLLAMWLALITHPLLDFMTVYGTQLALPFTNFPFAVGSVFIIDPLYTLPLLLGTGWALATARAAKQAQRWPYRANAIGLALSCIYLAWGVVAQQQAKGVATQALADQGINAQQVLVIPAPFNTLLWRVVAVSGEHYYEGFYSLLDSRQPNQPRISFARFERGNALAAELAGNLGVQRIQAFSQGFYKLHEAQGRVIITDLRMGQEPNYSFSFAVAQRGAGLEGLQILPKAEQLAVSRDMARALPWVWRRMWGEQLAPPR
jgi:inner membrane protein